MATNIILVLCVQAILAHVAFSQCMGSANFYDGIGAPFGLTDRGWGYDGVWGRGAGCGCGSPGIGITATTGGGLPVASASAVPPVGVVVASENVYEGILTAAGELPFVGTVGVEGVLPTAGAGAVNYGCGNGATAMVSDVAPGLGGGYGAYGAAGVAGPIASNAAFGFGGLGYGGWAGRGCGCNQ